MGHWYWSAAQRLGNPGINITCICSEKPKISCDSLYYCICFIVVVWNRTHNSCGVCLLFSFLSSVFWGLLTTSLHAREIKLSPLSACMQHTFMKQLLCVRQNATMPAYSRTEAGSGRCGLQGRVSHQPMVWCPRSCFILLGFSFSTCKIAVVSPDEW